MSYLGIDLGTTNSIGIIYDDKNNILNTVIIDGCDEILPSVVNYLDNKIIVGIEAKEEAIIYPETTFMSIKRFMGTDKKFLLKTSNKTPAEVSSEILKKIKLSAENQAKEKFDEVVITHPAYFNDSQIFDTKEAGLKAGFKNIFLLSEPLAAAIEYGYKQGYEQTLLVYDLGGGTFDACILNVLNDENGQELFQELSNIGDVNLGGDNFDNEIINLMKKSFKDQNSIDLDNLDNIQKKIAFQKLKQEAEIAKRKLSVSNKTIIKINPLIIYEDIPRNLYLEITREKFELMIKKYIDTTKLIIEKALKEANKRTDEISKVILVGGSTLIPMIKKMLTEYIKEPYIATDPAKSVAMGAAIYNYLIHLPNSNIKIRQITRQIFGTEAIIDINTMKKKLIPIIPMGSPIPIKISDKNFSNMIGSSFVNVDIYQWEKNNEENKKYIGTVILDGLSDETQIEISYALNENNIFEVYVKDLKRNIVKKANFNRKNIKLEKKNNLKNYNNINILFLMDTTGSMETYINGVKNRIIEFSNILNSKNINFRLGLIGFGDLNEKEKPSIYNFTNDINKFQKQLKNIPRNYGGDIPESSLDAMETGIELLKSSKFNEKNKNIFILITDAHPHVPTMSGMNINDIANILYEEKITTYIVARKDEKSKNMYNSIVKGNGKYYNLRDDFYDILDKIANNIVNLVRL